jgi:hypothetical protein
MHHPFIGAVRILGSDCSSVLKTLHTSEGSGKRTEPLNNHLSTVWGGHSTLDTGTPCHRNAGLNRGYTLV